MNAVQSYWITEDSVKHGGWINERFERISWSLSYFLLKKNFGSVHLYCNSAGFEFLVQQTGLQYDEIRQDLDGKEALIKKSWGLAKMYTYTAQDVPFVHVDGDVFWFDLPQNGFFEADIFAQSLEMDEPAYRDVWLSFKKHGAVFPEFLDSFNKAALAANAGIIGGQNPGVFKDFFQEAVNFLETNQIIIEAHKEEFKFLSIYIEQSFFICLINYLQIKIKFLKKPVFRTNFHEVLNFNQISPVSKTPGFIHLLGSNRYRLHYCNLMEFWLNRLWPEQLAKINGLYTSTEDSAAGFSNFLNPKNEKRLPHTKWLFDKPLDILNHPFIRTESIFGVNPAEISEDETLNHPETEKLSDCLAFENARCAILSQLLNTTNGAVLYSNFEIHLDFCSKSYAEIIDLTFELNPSKILKSKYNWFNDLSYQTQNYWYNLIIDSQKICFQEFLLSETECRIMELFEEKMSIENLYLAWGSQYPEENNQKTKGMIHETLKELISNDLIRIC